MARLLKLSRGRGILKGSNLGGGDNPLVTDQLLAWWPLDGDILDASSAPKIDGDTLDVGASFVSGVPESQQQALQCVLGDTLVLDTTNLDSVLSGLGEVSVSLWVYRTSFAGNNFEFAFKNAGAGGDLASFSGREIQSHVLYSSSGTTYWDCGQSNAPTNGPYDRIQYGPDTGLYGQWNHWVMTKNVTTGFMEIFLNNVSVSSNTIFPAKTIGTIAIGGLGIDCPTSILQDVRIYGKVLNGTEISTIYNAKGSKTGTPLPSSGYLVDTFTDSAVRLNAHIPDSGFPLWIEANGEWSLNGSGQAGPSNSTVDAVAVFDAGVSDTTIQCDIECNHGRGLVLRYVDNSNYLALLYNTISGRFELYTKVADSYIIQTGTPGFVGAITTGITYTWNVILTGDTVRFTSTSNGADIIGQWDVSQFNTATVFGIRANSDIDTAAFDNFSSSELNLVDPYYYNNELLLLFDGTDGETTYTDSSVHSLTFANIYTSQLDTAEKKYGTASFNAPTIGCFTRNSPPNDLITWWQDDFTIEYWIYPTTAFLTGSPGLSSGVGNFAYNGANMYWGFGPITGGVVRMYYFNGAGQTAMTTSSTINLNEWSHLAFTHTGGTARIFINGVKGYEGSVVGTPQANNSTPFTGFHYNNAQVNTGWMDELRVTRGIARYITDFTPPTTFIDTIP